MKSNTLRFLIVALLAACLLCTASGCASSKPEETSVTAQEHIEKPELIAPRNAAEDLLLVVDFQNIYLPGYDWACPSMPADMEHTMKLLDAQCAPECVMTKYVAPAEPTGRWRQYNEAYREINANAFLAQFPEALAPYAARTTVVEKSTYSSMDAPEVLAAMEGKKAVVLAGVVADCCVLATMMDAMDLGYEVVYLYDCIAGVSAQSEAEIRALAEVFSPIHTTVMSSDEYLSAIAAFVPEAKTADALPLLTADGDDAKAAPEKNGEVYVLFTSDVHCGVDQGFGYAGLAQIRDMLEAQGFTVVLADDGDAIQGEPIGMLTRGEAVITLMNKMGYDVAIPGNHEFDYGMERFLELADLAEFPYISCNFTYLDTLVFEPYTIIEAAGLKIGFVGVTTPETVTTSTPATFMNDAGETVYGFARDTSGEAVYAAVQSAVDAARAEGADLVYVMGHLGMAADCAPWTYADVIEHTGGIDVFLDGHSHDTQQVVMKDADGQAVTRCAVGTKLACIGYSHISAEGAVLETGVWSWTNDISAPELLGLSNEMSEAVDAETAKLAELTGQVVARSGVALLIYDPVEKTMEGFPLRLVRLTETNLGDFCADVLRCGTGADIGLISGGGIRADLPKGDITYGDIMSVWPYEKDICVLEATGQQILDALEWGVRSLPGESGAFLQVSGLSYEIDVSTPSGCIEDENSMMRGIEGERRVKHVMVGDKPIEPEKIYTVAGTDYTLLDQGDGFTAFDGATVVTDCFRVDYQLMIDYITQTLGGVIDSADYADPYGQGRIVISE